MTWPWSGWVELRRAHARFYEAQTQRLLSDIGRGESVYATAKRSVIADLDEARIRHADAVTLVELTGRIANVESMLRQVLVRLPPDEGTAGVAAVVR